MPLHLFEGRRTSTTPSAGRHRRRTSPGMSEKCRFRSRGFQIGPSVNLNPVAIRVTGASRSTRRSNAGVSAIWLMARDFLGGLLLRTLAHRLDARWPDIPVARGHFLENDPDVALADAG